MLKIKAFKVMPKHPKESNVMKILFSRKELSQKLKMRPLDIVEEITSSTESVAATSTELDRNPFKRTINEYNHTNETPDSYYEVTGILMSDPFDVTTSASTNALSSAENVEATSTAQIITTTELTTSNDAEVIIGDPAYQMDSAEYVPLPSSDSSQNDENKQYTATTSTTPIDTTAATQINESETSIAGDTSTQVHSAVYVPNAGYNVGSAQNSEDERHFATTATSASTSPSSASDASNAEAETSTKAPVAITSAATAKTTAESAAAGTTASSVDVACDTTQSLNDLTTANATSDNVAYASTAEVQNANTDISSSSSTSTGEAAEITSTTQAVSASPSVADKENDVATPFENEYASTVDSSSVADENVISTEEGIDTPEIDAENVAAEQIASSSSTEWHIVQETTQATVETTPASTLSPTPPPSTQNPIQTELTTSESSTIATSSPTEEAAATTAKNFDGGRVFVAEPMLGIAAPSTLPPAAAQETTTNSPNSPPFIARILEAVAKNPIGKNLFTNRPIDVNRNNNIIPNMLATPWKFNGPLFQARKIQKRHTEVLVTPSPRRSEGHSAPKTIFDRLQNENSVERAERRHKTVERLMHVATIAGHLDGFFTGRLKHGVKTLYKLFGTEEDSRGKL